MHRLCCKSMGAEIRYLNLRLPLLLSDRPCPPHVIRITARVLPQYFIVAFKKKKFLVYLKSFLNYVSLHRKRQGNA